MKLDVNAAAVNTVLAEVTNKRASDHRRLTNGDMVLLGDRAIEEDLKKASRIAEMSLNGPTAQVVCDRHDLWGDEPAWLRCQRVEVGSALLGYTCGEPT